MQFVAGICATATLVAVVFIAANWGYVEGQKNVANQLRDCLAVAATADICENFVLDRVFDGGAK